MKSRQACTISTIGRRPCLFHVALYSVALVGLLALACLLHVDSLPHYAVGDSAVDMRHRNVLKAIEEITVGDRVALAENPAEPFDETLGREVDPNTWRKITLRPDEQSRVVLLRPLWWIDERLDRTSGRLAVSVPEVGIAGDVEVVSIGPCPPLAQGRGPIVIGTFQHEAPGTILLTISGLAEPLRCTPNHAIWSHDRQQFVEAQSLRTSELVATRYGLRRLASVSSRVKAVTVYNLEVLGQHVYQVSPLGLLAHNASPGGSGPVDLSETSRRRALDAAQRHAQVQRRYRQDFDAREINAQSRAKNAAEVQRQGGTHFGRRDIDTGAYYQDHPDGHPHMMGPGFPAHHGSAHVHAVDARGREIIITYPFVTGGQ